jgi:hypothetical protein
VPDAEDETVPTTTTLAMTAATIIIEMIFLNFLFINTSVVVDPRTSFVRVYYYNKEKTA